MTVDARQNKVTKKSILIEVGTTYHGDEDMTLGPVNAGAAGTDFKYHNYNHPVYLQYHGKFMPYMNVMDLTFNHGKKSPDILPGKNLVDTGVAS